MFVVIFEVQPKKERWDDYLALAKQLKPKLEAIDGFIDNERFRSQAHRGTPTLALDLARREGRDPLAHPWRASRRRRRRAASRCSRTTTCASAKSPPIRCPPQGMRISQQRLDETEIGAAKSVTITEITPSDGGADALPAALGLDHRRAASWITSCSRASTRRQVPAARFLAGRRCRRRLEDRHRSRNRCATARCASSATTGCSIAAKHRSSTPP